LGQLIRRALEQEVEGKELGVEILEMAGELGISYYDAAYLAMAQKPNRTDRG